MKRRNAVTTLDEVEEGKKVELNLLKNSSIVYHQLNIKNKASHSLNFDIGKTEQAQTIKLLVPILHKILK